MTSTPRYTNLSIKKLPNAEIEATGEIPVEVAVRYRTKALAHLNQETKLPGFRPGHIPEATLIARVGEASVWYEIAEHALRDAYGDLLESEKLDIIGTPQISLTKVAPGNPIGFTIRAALFPEITLPDYKKLAKAVTEAPDDLTISDEEFEKTLAEILKRAAAKPQNEEAATEPSEPEVPALTDEFVKTLGDFANVEDFKAKLRENMAHEKEHRANEKKRADLMDRLVEGATIDLPKILVDSELSRMLAQFKEDVTRVGAKFEDYLSHIKKTEADLRTEWEPEAQKRAKLQLILNEIAEREKIMPDQAAIEQQSAQILAQFKDADPARVRIYIASQLQNQKVLEFLEGEERDS